MKNSDHFPQLYQRLLLFMGIKKREACLLRKLVLHIFLLGGRCCCGFVEQEARAPWQIRGLCSLF